MDAILTAILEDDRSKVKELLKTEAGLATGLVDKPRLYEAKIVHWIYAGDTALHLAAAGHRIEIVRLLLTAGADPNATMNHRQSSPLHYAADGSVNRICELESGTAEYGTIQCLLEAGAEINAQDKNGASPLDRAVRMRSTSAVKCLLQCGSNPTLKNKSGSTSFHLAVQDTGRGGTGSEVARVAQREIIHEFLSLGLSLLLKDSKGKSVFDCARSVWIRSILSGAEKHPGGQRE